jgi:hypothetical protein
VNVGLLSSVGLIAGLAVALIQMSRVKRAQDETTEMSRRAGLVSAVMNGGIGETEYRDGLGSPEAIAWAEAHRATLTAMESLRDSQPPETAND